MWCGKGRDGPLSLPLVKDMVEINQQRSIGIYLIHHDQLTKETNNSNISSKKCRQLDLNLDLPVSKATAVPTVPQPHCL